MTQTTMPASMPSTRPAASRTPAERAIIDGYDKAASALPGAGWVQNVRQEALGWLQANGLPSRRVEAFKYTDLRERLKEAWPPLMGQPDDNVTTSGLEAALGSLAALGGPRLVFVDGVFAPGLSRTVGLAAEAVEQMPLAPLLRKAPAWLEGKFASSRLGEQNAPAALNTLLMSDGLMIKVKPGQSVSEPILLVSLRASAAPGTIALRNIVAMEAGASMTLVEVHAALPGAPAGSIVAPLTDVTVADGASFSHIVCSLDRASFLPTTVAKVGSESGYRLFQLTAAPRLARNGITVEMAGADSKLDISGAFLVRDSEHVDTTLTVDHKMPGCESRELFKGVLFDRARGVFQGKIIVRPGADKTDGKQMARALLLSEDAEFDSKPELEIYADDVACGHGATAAALDDDLMFYCRSRGIPEAEARGLLIEAFIGEAIDKVEHDGLREALMETARGWLAGGSGT